MYPLVNAYSLSMQFVGIKQEIKDYKYLVEFEGRRVERVDTNVYGNYTIYVEVSDSAGRTTIQKVMELVVETPEAVAITKVNNIKVIIASILGIIFVSMMILGYVLLKRRKS